MAIRNALPFEFPYRWNDLRRFVSGLREGDPEAAEAVDFLDQRDRDLEDFLADLGGGGPHVIDFGDALVLVGYSRKFYIAEDRTLDLVAGQLDAAGSTDTVLRVVHNGSLLADALTIPAGDTTATLALAEAFAAGDNWQIYVQTAGTDAFGLAVFGEFT